MRGLTVRQPWAWAIIHGGKDVENRTRSLGPYRGPVAIHAGLGVDHDASDLMPALSIAWEGCDPALYPAGRHPWIRGAVIGVVDLVASHQATTAWVADEVCEDEGCTIGGNDLSWAHIGAWHLVLANPRPLARPIPWRGFLGLWRVPDELEAAIREQVDLGAVD